MPNPSSPFDRYLQKHGHLPSKTFALGASHNGKHRIKVVTANGYIDIHTLPYASQISIPRSTCIDVIKFIVPALKMMTRSFSIEDAIHQSYLEEKQHHNDLRQMKRSLYRPPQ